ncbi:hypothetical protein D3C71_273450 [compost metagenome]
MADAGTAALPPGLPFAVRSDAQEISTVKNSSPIRNRQLDGFALSWNHSSLLVRAPDGQCFHLDYSVAVYRLSQAAHRAPPSNVQKPCTWDFCSAFILLFKQMHLDPASRKICHKGVEYRCGKSCLKVACLLRKIMICYQSLTIFTISSCRKGHTRKRVSYLIQRNVSVANSNAVLSTFGRLKL